MGVGGGEFASLEVLGWAPFGTSLEPKLFDSPEVAADAGNEGS